MTITSNIHYNLSVWTSTTYSLGNRVFTGSVGSGNTYQCTTAGSSTSGPTGTGTGINNGGVAVWKWLSSYDYSDVQSWATAIPGTPSVPYVGQLWNNGLISVTTSGGASWLIFTGHTTTATNTITLTAAPGEGFRDMLAGQATACAWASTTGVSIQFAVGNGFSTNYQTNFIYIVDSYVIIDGLQFQDLGSIYQNTIVLIGNSVISTLRNCIFDGYAQIANAASVIECDCPMLVTNCLFVDRGLSSNTVSCLSIGYSGSFSINGSKVANCTFYAVNSSNGGNACWMHGTGGAAVVTLTNNMALNYTTAFYNNSTGTTNAVNCLVSGSSLGTAITSVSGNLTSKTAANQFVAPGTDFRLLSTADAKNAGTTDSTDIPTTDDIVRTTRPQGTAWDIGCWELKIAAGFPFMIWMD